MHYMNDQATWFPRSTDDILPKKNFPLKSGDLWHQHLDLGENSGSPLALIYHSFRQLVMAVKLMAWRKLL